MVVTSEEMLRLEERAFARGVSAQDLMEKAGIGISRVVTQFAPQPGILVLVLGKGNNAGDALVAARELVELGWKLKVRRVYDVDDFKPLPRLHWDSLAGKLEEVTDLAELEREPGNLVILDGLLGIGTRGKARGKLAEVIEEVNQFRKRRHAMVVAMDLPSGLEGFLSDSGVCINADVTATVGVVKSALLEDAATNLAGRLALVELPELELEAKSALATQQADGKASGLDGDRGVIMPTSCLGRLHKRGFDFHKGQAGRVGIVAGGRGTLGAAVLSAKGALKGGGGLVTVYAKPDIYEMLAVMMPTEVMVKMVDDYRSVVGERLDALVIGPGLGKGSSDEIMDLIQTSTSPMVVDADGLNVVAERGTQTVLQKVKTPVLLTPHPGEMSRLIQHRPDWESLDRASLARSFTDAFPGSVLLLKGSRTVIARRGQPLAFNSTGTPGMASGGMGDVLSGLIGALIAGGLSTYDAACLGSWLIGRAAEVAITTGAASEESLSATEVAANLGAAFQSLKRLEY